MKELKNICDYSIFEEEDKLLIITNNILNYFNKKGRIDLDDDNFFMWVIEDKNYRLRLWTSLDFRIDDKIRNTLLFTDFMLYINKTEKIDICKIYTLDGYKKIYQYDRELKDIFKYKYMTFWEIYLEKLMFAMYLMKNYMIGVILKWKSS